MPPRVAALHPLSAIEGGRITLEGSDFAIDQPRLIDCETGTFEGDAAALDRAEGVKGGDARRHLLSVVELSVPVNVVAPALRSVPKAHSDPDGGRRGRTP